jgi:hypothetical protein
VLLIDKDGILALLGNSTFSLKPNESIKDTLHTVIPPGVEESPYGINAVIPGSGTVTGTIWVGQIGDSPAGPWPTYTECAMGPLGSSEYSIDGGPY